MRGVREAEAIAGITPPMLREARRGLDDILFSQGLAMPNGAKLRDAISKMDHNTVLGRFRVDRDGVQIGHKLLLIQWQDGKRAIVWPEELAPNQPRFPTPPWSQRL